MPGEVEAVDVSYISILGGTNLIRTHKIAKGKAVLDVMLVY